MATVIDAKVHYRPVQATRLAHLALEVYQSPEAIQRVATAYWGEDCDITFINVESTQCALLANATEIVVAFRGTEQRLEDWIVDLDFSLTAGPLPGSVHEGFYDGLSLVWSSLDERVRGLLAARPRELFVTGHSLGGALAALAAAQWRREGVLVDGVYTYGQPRVGDNKFSRSFDLAMRPRCFRIVNHLDTVTRTPPRAIGYSHAGTLVYLDEHGQAQHDICWWQSFLDGWCGAIDKILDWCGEGLDDHRMTNYLQRLSQLAPAPKSDPDVFSFAAHQRQRQLARPRRRAA